MIDKRVINGQRVTAGEELYRIADLSRSGSLPTWPKPILPRSRSAPGDGDFPRLSDATGRRPGHLHLSGTADGNANRARPHRTAQSRRTLEGRICTPTSCSKRQRRSRRRRGSSQRRDRQRHAAGRADRQGRGPLRAAAGQARPARRRLCRGHRRRERRRTGGHLGNVPDRRREQSARRRCKPSRQPEAPK